MKKIIEGSAFLDGDSFCPEASPERCQESWVFVPNCKHETKEELHLGDGEYRATIIIEMPDED